MKRLFAAAIVAGGISASVSTASATTVGIDFGCGSTNGTSNCVSGDAPLQDGYLGWAGQYAGSPQPWNETRSFNSDFGADGTFDINLTSTGLFFRDYSSLTGTYAGQSDLLSDNILLNTAGSIVFTFSGLTAGTYSMESFHHDSNNGETTIPFDIIVADLLGTRTVASGIDTSGTQSPTAITTALYAFTVDAGGTASITFNTTAAVSGQHMSINGFQLTSPVPLPAGVWLLLSALGGLGFAGWRRKRMAT